MPPPSPIQLNSELEVATTADLNKLAGQIKGRKFKPRSPEVRVRPDFTAQQQLEKIQDEERKARATLEREDADRYQHFIKCRRGHVGVFLTVNPTGRIIGLGDWYATYRDVTDDWREEVYCQVCYNCDMETGEPQGTLQPLQVTYVSTRRSVQFVVPPEWSWRYPKDEARRIDEGVTRAARVDYGSGNPDWIASAGQLSKTEKARREALRLVGGVV